MPYDEKEWKKAKALCRLNTEDIRIAREMGLNPRSLIKNIPNSNQQWKLPVRNWLRAMYRQKKERGAKQHEIPGESQIPGSLTKDTPDGNH